MAKKKHRKKHQFKYTAPAEGAPASPSASAIQPPSQAAVSRPVGSKPASGQSLAGLEDFGYVTQDLRRIGLLAAVFIVLQIILWYGFNHTGLGPNVYHWIRL